MLVTTTEKVDAFCNKSSDKRLLRAALLSHSVRYLHECDELWQIYAHCWVTASIQYSFRINVINSVKHGIWCNFTFIYVRFGHKQHLDLEDWECFGLKYLFWYKAHKKMSGNFPKVSLKIWCDFTHTNVETPDWTVVTDSAAGSLPACNSTTIPSAPWYGSQLIHVWCERDLTLFIEMSIKYVAY